MSLMPFPHYVAAGGTPFTMTAAIGFGSNVGWFEGFFGSVDQIVNVNGGDLAGVYFSPGVSSHAVLIEDTSSGISNINVDGTDYSLTFDSNSSGIDIYIFGPASSIFSDGVDYEITVT